MKRVRSLNSREKVSFGPLSSGEKVSFAVLMLLLLLSCVAGLYFGVTYHV